MIGRLRPVAVPCDDHDENGKPRRVWDVVYQDRVLWSSIGTRAEARRLTAKEREEIGR